MSDENPTPFARRMTDHIMATLREARKDRLKQDYPVASQGPAAPFDEAMEKRANALAEMAESKIQSLMCDQLHLRAAEVFFLEVFSDVETRMRALPASLAPLIVGKDAGQIELIIRTAIEGISAAMDNPDWEKLYRLHREFVAANAGRSNAN